MGSEKPQFRKKRGWVFLDPYRSICPGLCSNPFPWVFVLSRLLNPLLYQHRDQHTAPNNNGLITQITAHAFANRQRIVAHPQRTPSCNNPSTNHTLLLFHGLFLSFVLLTLLFSSFSGAGIPYAGILPPSNFLESIFYRTRHYQAIQLWVNNSVGTLTFDSSNKLPTSSVY